MMIGNAAYQCSCVRYVPQDNNALIIGLSVGLGLLLIIIVVTIAIFLYRRHQGKLPEQAEMSNVETSMDKDDDDKPYSRRLPGDYSKTANVFGKEDGEYSRSLPEDVAQGSEL